MRVSPFSFHLCGDSLFKVHAALVLTFAATAYLQPHPAALDWIVFAGYTRIITPAALKSQVFLQNSLCSTLYTKTDWFFVQFDGWTVTRRAYTLLYITRLSCPALAIKKFNRFPLCYYYIESMRFCQAFQESFTFPNMTDCTNTKRMVHSERPGHSKHSRQPSRQVFSPSSLYSRARKLTIGAYIPPAKSWKLSPILCFGKVDSSSIYI